MRLLKIVWNLYYLKFLGIERMLREEIPGTYSKKKTKVIVEQNHYRLGELLGQGTFGKVYQAIDQRTGEKVAIKEVFQDNRFKNRELEVISRLDNDNVIFMKDYYFVKNKDHKYLYLVMDFFEGSLQNMLKQFRKAKLKIDRKVAKILSFQLMKALYYLGNNKICHRDLKPPNILINPETLELRVCDFGSAKILEKGERNVTYICSRYYRAPELLFEYTEYQTEIDVWSAGCIMVEFFTKEPIFPGDSSIQQLIEIIKILGSPCRKYLNKYAKQVEGELNLPKVPASGWQKVLKMFKPEPEFIDMISKILVYDMESRLKPYEILSHKYFHDLINPEYQKFTSSLPNIFEFLKMRTPTNSKQILQLHRMYNKSGKSLGSESFQGQKSDNFELRMETNDSTPNNALHDLAVNTNYSKPGNLNPSLQNKEDGHKC